MSKDALDEVGEQILDEELSQLSPEEITGSWRGLCAMMLLRTVSILGKSHSSLVSRKAYCLQKSAAERWLAGESSIIPFSEVLQALDMDREYVLRGIAHYAKSSQNQTRIKVGTKQQGESGG